MRAEGFSGREDVAAAVYALLSHKLPSPVRCVYGRSGSGKTSVCCLTAVSAGNTGQWSCVVFRACGTSAGSSDALSLLASISAQLQLAAGEVAGGPKREFDEQVRMLSVSYLRQGACICVRMLVSVFDRTETECRSQSCPTGCRVPQVPEALRAIVTAARNH